MAGEEPGDRHPLGDHDRVLGGLQYRAIAQARLERPPSPGCCTACKRSQACRPCRRLGRAIERHDAALIDAAGVLSRVGREQPAPNEHPCGRRSRRSRTAVASSSGALTARATARNRARSTTGECAISGDTERLEGRARPPAAVRPGHGADARNSGPLSDDRNPSSSRGEITVPSAPSPSVAAVGQELRRMRTCRGTADDTLARRRRSRTHESDRQTPRHDTASSSR